MLVLALLDERERHGYEIAQLIEQRSNGEIRFRVPSLYPLLYRLEDRGLVHRTLGGKIRGASEALLSADA